MLDGHKKKSDVMTKYYIVGSKHNEFFNFISQQTLEMPHHISRRLILISKIKFLRTRMKMNEMNKLNYYYLFVFLLYISDYQIFNV